MLQVLDLFSGIGGFSLGLERSGMRTVAFCEIEAYCQAILRKHWPHVPIYNDVRTLTADRLQADGIAVDLICGGFPCQDISVAGKGTGIEGERSGLWSEYARIIGEVRPRYVIVENVSALLGRGLVRVLGDLAALGFDAEWHCIPASAVGAPHRRDRVWIVAHTSGKRRQQISRSSHGHEAENEGWSEEHDHQPSSDGEGYRETDVADATCDRWTSKRQWPAPGHIDWSRELQRGRSAHWLVEPPVGRLANGIPHRLDRLRALGNAVVPQIPEMIGRAILSHETA